MKIRRENANDRVRPRAQGDSLAHNVGIAGKSLLPQRIAQDRDVILPVHLFFRGKEAAEKRLYLHDIEETVADLRAEDPLRRACAGQDRTKIAVGADLFENVISRAVIRYVGR